MLRIDAARSINTSECTESIQLNNDKIDKN